MDPSLFCLVLRFFVVCDVDGNFSSLNELSKPPTEETFGIRAESHCVRDSLTRDSALSSCGKSPHLNASPLSPALDRGTEEMTLFHTGSMDRENFFDVNELDVATHAARCAFLRTLRSPFEANAKTVLVDSPKEHVPSNWGEHRRVHARRLDAETRLHRMSGRGRVSDAQATECSKTERRARSKRSLSILPKFRSWFMCFTAQENAQEPTSMRKPTHRHLPTESSKGRLCSGNACEVDVFVGFRFCHVAIARIGNDCRQLSPPISPSSRFHAIPTRISA